MILFFISLLLILGFAFCFANIFESESLVRNCIYFIVSAFANIIFTFELLSIFSSISEFWVLILNLLLFVVCAVIWARRGFPIIKVDIREFFNRFKNAISLDNSLLFLFSGVIFVLLVSLIVIIYSPSNDGTDLFYHVVRALFWIDHGNLNHFNVADARIVSFPINSELLYSWVFLFLKKDICIRSFSFIAYVLYITALYGIMGEFTVSLRRKLWVVFAVSSFTAVITYISSNDTTIMVAALISASIYLLLEASKFKKNSISLYMSSLALALSVGVKTSALFVLPALVVWYLVLGWRFREKAYVKNFWKFSLYFIINFILFASYNYILNFINYGSVISIPSLTYSHQNQLGIKGFAFNLLNYIMMPVTYPEYGKFLNISSFWGNLQSDLFKLLGGGFLIGRYSTSNLGAFIISDLVGLGIGGVIIFFPCLYLAFAGVFRKSLNKFFLLNSFSLLFFIPFLLMTYSLTYMTFNIRFIVTFALISMPVIYYSYHKKLTVYKFIAVFLAFASLWYVPINITYNNVFDILKYIRRGYSISEIHEALLCGNSYLGKNIYCQVRDYAEKLPKNNKLLYFSQEGEALFYIKSLQLKGYDVDVDLIENIENINLDQYDYVITLENRQASSLFDRSVNFDSDEYRRKGLNCFYNEYNANLILDPNKGKPAILYCYLDGNYFKNRNFSLFDILKFSENINGITNHFSFYVYKNNRI